MSIWLLAPSIRHDAGEVFAQWQARGYKVAALIDATATEPPSVDVLVGVEKYEGYGASINRLWSEIAVEKPDLIIAGADDLYPCEDRTADELASDFFEHFPGGFGVMHLGKFDLSAGTSTDHCWIGAEYARRINGGKGPVWPEYRHYFDDTELGCVADALGVLWRRPEYGQRHDHWTLKGNERPAHLAQAGEGWARARALFKERQAAGFPGSEPSGENETSHR
jgi:hypothetical protein